MQKHKWSYEKKKNAHGVTVFELVEDKIELSIDFADEASAKRAVQTLNDYEKRQQELNEDLKRIYGSLNGG